MTFRHTLALLLVCVLSEPALCASGPAVDAAEPGWEFSITPYAWLPGISGEMNEGGTTTDIELSAVDALLSLNWGGFVQGEARHGRWLIGADMFALNTTSEINTGVQTLNFPGETVTQSFRRNVTTTVDVGGVERELGPISVGGILTVDIPGFSVDVGPLDIEANTQLVMVDLMGGYRVLDRPVAGFFGGPVADSDKRKITLDLFGGARYWDVKGWIDVSTPPVVVPSFNVTASAQVGASFTPTLPPNVPIEAPTLSTQRRVDFDGIEVPANTVVAGGTRRIKITERWVDPVIGVRLRGDFAENWYWLLSGDIGGFGIGSASKFTWQALGGVGWRFGEHWSTQLVWRALEIEREDAASDIRLRLHGPQLGFTYTF